QLQVPGVENLAVGEVPVLVGAVGLQPEALVAHGRGAEPGPGAEAGGGVKGSAKEDDLGLFKGGIAGDKGLNVGFHIILPPPAFSPGRPGGRMRRCGAGRCNSWFSGAGPATCPGRSRRWGDIS